LLGLAGEVFEAHIAEPLPDVRPQVRLSRFHAGRLLVSKHLLFPPIREVLNLRELSRPVIGRVDFRQDRFKSCDAHSSGVFNSDTSPRTTRKHSVYRRRLREVLGKARMQVAVCNAISSERIGQAGTARAMYATKQTSATAQKSAGHEANRRRAGRRRRDDSSNRLPDSSKTGEKVF
jgi:hypothetical protein